MPGEYHSRQKRYLKRRYAEDLDFRAARQAGMRQYTKAQYANNVAFKQRQQAAQREWYARQAALLSVRHLFEAPPPRKCRAARSMDARLLEFCRDFLAGNGA